MSRGKNCLKQAKNLEIMDTYQVSSRGLEIIAMLVDNKLLSASFQALLEILSGIKTFRLLIEISFKILGKIAK